MTKSEFIIKAKKLISEVKKEEVFALLKTFLKENPRYNPLQNRLISLENRWKRTKEEAGKGILSFEQKNLRESRITDALLELIDDIKNDNITVKAPEKTINSNSKKTLLALSFSLVIAALFFWVYKNQVIKKEGCITCNPKETFQITVIPFYNPANDGLRPQGSIVERLEVLSSKKKIKTCVGIFDGPEPESYLQPDVAAELVMDCDAEIVVWGRAEKEGEENIIKTGFRFLGEKTGLEFNELEWEGSEVKKVKTLSSIAESGELTAGIEQVVSFIFGVTCQQKGKVEIALENLEAAEIPVEDDNAYLIQKMLIADIKLDKGQDSLALATLEQTVKAHPEYWLAWNNLAALNMQAENYVEASYDYSELIKLREKNNPDTAKTIIKAVNARGTANLKAEHFKDAAEDFERVKKNAPNTPNLQQNIEKTKNQIQRQEEIIENSETDIRKNPRDVKAYQKKAAAQRKLGRYREAMEVLKRAEELDTKITEILLMQAEYAAEMNDSKRVNEAADTAERKGIKRSIILNNKAVKLAKRMRRIRVQ